MGPMDKRGIHTLGCVYHQMNRNISGPNCVLRHWYNNTHYPGGISTPEASLWSIPLQIPAEKGVPGAGLWMRE